MELNNDTYRMIRLVRRPHGLPERADFAVTEEPVPEPGPGQVLIRNTWMSIDPLMRVRMDERTGVGHVPPFRLGQPLDGSAVGRVVASRSARFAPGDVVLNHGAWQEMLLCDAGEGGWFDPMRVEVPDGLDERHYLGVLGVSGLTAYVGLRHIGAVAPGETVYVSAAGGAVGGVAAQLAVAWGHQVVASAGSADKVRRALEEYGVHAAFNHRDGEVSALLAAAAPGGIDVYYDNVGGDHLEAALDCLRPGGRVVLCGQVSSVGSATGPRGPRNLMQAIFKGVRLEGFMVRHHARHWPAYLQEARDLMARGRLTLEETTYDGLDAAPDAIVAMLSGRTAGKVTVRL
ncbi:NADP-dependent oxidoreductase [Acrocarpospora catenulata]|uniref:NADP-dependent oxidoreductase n=1 Tax=Acrocarpospora catenulata TaxID=2836182 RepID=UPI0027DF3314|nr:NADP-dependent oxidoreductase [Acrocarpospora catenulata]